MLIDVSNKVVVVTGSSKGIGRELIRVFSKEKAKVVINYIHSEDAATELYNEVLQYNTNCIKVKADVTKYQEVLNLYHKTLNAFGRVDILINNAGICDDNPIHLMAEEQWRKVIDINLTGTYLCSRVFSKIMIQQKDGKIINIASLKGQEGCAGQVNYSASKAGIIGFTKALAKELGRFNIAVNAVCPGFIVTDLNRHNEEKKRIAMNRSLLPIKTSMEDLTNFLVYMSSDKFNNMSGRVYNLDSRL
jgi:Dehydrogenases with different specificities (related to short-chain alcohol dehydrogenases)